MFSEHPRWSPDGSKIAFAGIGGGKVDIYVVGADGSGLRQLTSSPGWEQEPVWSPDGTQIAYIAWPTEAADIFVMNADGSGVRDITNSRDGGDFHPSWSASGILFTSNRDGLDALYVMQPDGSGLRRLTSGRVWESDSSWSRDGQQLVFVSGRNARFEIGAYANGSYRSLTHGPGVDSDPAWSPDGRLLAYAHAPRRVTSDIYSLDIRTGRRKNLTRGRGLNWSPVWSPRGDRIAFVRFESFGAQLWIMNRDGTGQHAVTSQGSWNEHPSWAPDGRHLVFDARRNGSYDLYVLDLQAKRVRRLTRGAAARQPTWSPDGALIAFTAPDRYGFWRIWLIEPDGTRRQLFDDDVTVNAHYDPAWSPDGTKVVFTVEDFYGHDTRLYTIDRDTTVMRRATTIDWDQTAPAWQPLR
jgi:TolB protein